MVITTNLEFSRWGAVFGDDQMAAAVIGRLVHHGRLVQFRGESYRVRNALMQEGQVLKKGAHARCANCSIPDDHSAQKLLTKHRLEDWEARIIPARNDRAGKQGIFLLLLEEGMNAFFHGAE